MDKSKEKLLVKKVLVIGGGVSGLVSVKSALEAELGEVICYEQAECIGGLWSYQKTPQEHRGSVSLNTTVNTSKETMSFSDFPMDDYIPNYLTHRGVKEYLENYSKNFDLSDHIILMRKVLNVSLNKDKFHVESKDITSGEKYKEIFDYVIVCNGRNYKKKWAKFPNESDFKGKISHGYEFRNPQDFVGKRVVIVGIGNTAVDIAVDLSKISPQVYLSTEKGSYIVHRTGNRGLPVDLIATRRLMQHVIDAMPKMLYNRLASYHVNNYFDHDLYGLTPKYGFSEVHPTVSDDLCNRIITGEVKIMKNIKCYTKRGVIFTDDVEVEIDEVILATGYLIDFPFLHHDIVKVDNNKLDMFRKIFIPNVKNMCFIGFIQPLSSVPPVCEMQARYAVQVFKKNIKLPTVERMERDILRGVHQNRRDFLNTSRHRFEVKAFPYMEMLAADIGCNLSQAKLLVTDPRLAYACWFGVLSATQYRLYGPNKWGGARASLLDLWRRVETPFGRQRALLRSQRSGALPAFGFVMFWLTLVNLIVCFKYFNFSSLFGY